MARLILLNGAPGVGKSTIARRLADHHPLMLVLDIDVVRSLLGAEDDDHDITASWLAARALALAMAEVHLRAGHDVVVPQYLGRPAFIEQLTAVARTTRSHFVEIVLVIGCSPGEARFVGRGDVPQLVGARESYGEMHARLDELLVARPWAVQVDASEDAETAVAAVQRVLDAR